MKSLEVIYNGTPVTLEFNEPTKLVYSMAFSAISKNDYYEAIQIMLINCLVESDLSKVILDDEPFKMGLSGQIMPLLFNLHTVNVEHKYTGEKFKALYNELRKKYTTVFVVFVGEEDVIFIKGLERQDYKNLFNKTIQSPLMAMNYINTELLVGGDDIYGDDKKYASCFMLSEYLLKFKENELKKK